MSKRQESSCAWSKKIYNFESEPAEQRQHNIKSRLRISFVLWFSTFLAHKIIDDSICCTEGGEGSEKELLVLGVLEEQSTPGRRKTETELKRKQSVQHDFCNPERLMRCVGISTGMFKRNFWSSRLVLSAVSES